MPRRTRKAPPADHQCAALCWREVGAEVEILLITSRNTGRWVLPKGWVMKKKTPAESAAQEAWEEAGVEGIASPRPLGRYRYAKPEFGKGYLSDVVVFSLEVKNMSPKYPERGQRDQLWVPAKSAAELVDETQLAKIITSFNVP